MVDPAEVTAMQTVLIGCCGAYCGTCPPLKDNTCKGCRLGYYDGKRDLKAARCAMKRCCLLEKKLNTCADCPGYPSCRTIREFHAKKGYKYARYRQSMEFIRQYGYAAFLVAVRSWKRAYGPLNRPNN